MNTKYTIKNFRVFDEKGVTVDIKPITILTGCNSSGKSSIVKSMVLFNTYIESLVEDYKAFKRIDLKKHKLNFTKETTFNLGNFTRVLHKGSNDKFITFEYQVHPLILGEDVIVSFCFDSDENDTFCQGYLYAITIRKPNGDVIYTSSKKEPLKTNYNLILNNFFRFVYGQFLVELWDDFQYRRKQLYGFQSEEDFHKSMVKLPRSLRAQEEETVNNLKMFEKAIDDYQNSFEKAYGEDALHEIEAWMLHKGNLRLTNALGIEKKIPSLIEKWANGQVDILDVSLKYMTLFYFPLLERLYNVDSNSFKKVLYELTEKVTCKKEVFLAIDKITSDFLVSKKKTFGEYYKELEFSFLKKKSTSFKDKAPFIGGTRFLRINSNNIDEGYLNWTRRILGPAVTEYEGKLISMIGSGEKEKWEKCPIDFALVYDVLMNINYLIDPSDSKFYTQKESDLIEEYSDFNHYLFGMFREYATMVIEETVTKAIPQSLSYVTTSLVNVKRDYSFDSNDSFANLVKRYFIAQRNYKNSRANGILGSENFISKWVRKLGIGHSVSFEVSNSGSSFVVRLYKSEVDKVGTLLAEEGYGITQVVTLLIRIETAILESEKNVDVDEHELPFCTFSASTIAIEEPEVHLHPMFQSKLAEMFVDAYRLYNVHFIIETHSEYLIRKLQTLIAKDDLSVDDMSILYVYDADINKRPLYTPQVKGIGINPDGRLSDSFGEGFYDEADRLSMSLLDIKVKNDEKD